MVGRLKSVFGRLKSLYCRRKLVAGEGYAITCNYVVHACLGIIALKYHLAEVQIKSSESENLALLSIDQ